MKKVAYIGVLLVFCFLANRTVAQNSLPASVGEMSVKRAHVETKLGSENNNNNRTGAKQSDVLISDELGLREQKRVVGEGERLEVDFETELGMRKISDDQKQTIRRDDERLEIDTEAEQGLRRRK